MIKEALEYLVELGTARIETIGTQKFSTQPMHLIKSPTAKPILLNSLSGLLNYLTSDFDVDANQPLLAHIASPSEVNVYSNCTPDLDRSVFVQAKALIPSFNFGQYYNIEEFNIALQSRFVASETRSIILKIVGNIRDENVTTFGDDGVSQQVTAKVGIATVGNVRVPNPVFLKPYRTFVEIEQPESAFVLRLRSSSKDAPECALFEADGGAWKNEAIDTIRHYLVQALGEKVDTKFFIIA